LRVLNMFISFGHECAYESLNLNGICKGDSLPPGATLNSENHEG